MKGTLLHKMLLSTVIAILCITLTGCSGCNGGLEGKYQDESHLVTIELGPGGKGSFAFGAVSTPATYTVDGNKITIDVKGDKSVFTLNSDGSLSGPPESPFGKFQKVN